MRYLVRFLCQCLDVYFAYLQNTFLDVPNVKQQNLRNQHKYRMLPVTICFPSSFTLQPHLNRVTVNKVYTPLFSYAFTANKTSTPHFLILMLSREQKPLESGRHHGKVEGTSSLTFELGICKGR